MHWRKVDFRILRKENRQHADVDAAVKAATDAFESWKKVGIQEKNALLLKIADLIDENADRLAMVETLDNGKPLRETKTVDVPSSADHFRYFAGVIRSEEGTAKALDENTLTINLKEPIGVVGQIVPWNFPLLMAALNCHAFLRFLHSTILYFYSKLDK